jgi:hypothetical protein
MRLRIGARLSEAQSTAVLLTTFNEIDYVGSYEYAQATQGIV